MDHSAARRGAAGNISEQTEETSQRRPGACPFCSHEGRELVAQNSLAFAIPDGFPVSPGHTLIIPKRHVPNWFDASREEQIAILELADVVKARLDAEGAEVPLPGKGSHLKKSAAWSAEPGTRLRPDGYNIGLNCGEAAGQTVMHLHLHLIPRYLGDHHDPRGGVRWIFPEKAKYWDE